MADTGSLVGRWLDDCDGMANPADDIRVAEGGVPRAGDANPTG